MTDIRARLAKHNSALTVLNGIAAGGVDRISIKNSFFTLIDADGTKTEVATRHLDVIILVGNPNVSRQYFEGAYDPANDKGPDCYSHNGVGPSTGCSRPQNATCEGCPHNEWGSGRRNDGTPSEGKRCAERKLLAVSVGCANGKAYQLNIPTTSLRNLYTYIREVCKTTRGNYPMEPYDVFTRITFDSTKMGQVLMFHNIGQVPEKNLGFIADLLDSGQVADLIAVGDKPRAALAAPERARQIEAPAPTGASAAERIAAAKAAQTVREAPSHVAAPRAAEPTIAVPEAVGGDLDALLSAGGFGFPG
jgi:hypothetical protein